MSEDDPTKDLPNEDAPTADPLPAPDTAPMLEKILAEAYKTRDLLLTEIREVKTELRRLNGKFDILSKDMIEVRADVAAVEGRVDTLEGNRP